MVRLWVKLLPQLARFETTHDRKMAHRQAVKDVRLPHWYLACLVVLLTTRFVYLLVPLNEAEVVVEEVFAIAVTCCVVMLPWAFRHRARRSLRIQLRERGEPICISCGYNLTGNVSGTCPECGTKA